MPKKKETEGFDLKHYIMNNGKLLTREENIELVKRLQSGDKEAENEFILNNGKLVVSIISKEFPLLRDNDDIFQQGLIGLVEGAKRYDESYETAVGTHCYFWVKQRIQRYIADCESTIRIPVHMHEVLIKIRTLRNKYESEQEKECSFKEYIMNNIPELTEENYKDIAPYIDGVVSLNKPIGEDEHGEVTELMDFIANKPDNFSDSIEDSVLSSNLSDELIKILDKALDTKELEVIKRRFGFYGQVETLEEIGKDYNVTRERIRQIEEKALKKLRSQKYKNMLADYMN